MKKYEYKVVNRRIFKAKKIEKMINDFSAEEWELFNVHSYDLGTGVRFIFRKEIN